MSSKLSVYRDYSEKGAQFQEFVSYPFKSSFSRILPDYNVSEMGNIRVLYTLRNET